MAKKQQKTVKISIKWSFLPNLMQKESILFYLYNRNMISFLRLLKKIKC